MRLTFHDFKHNYNQCAFALMINCQKTCCPIKLLLDYFALWGQQPGAIFVTHTGMPHLGDTFMFQLSDAICLYGLDLLL